MEVALEPVRWLDALSRVYAEEWDSRGDQDRVFGLEVRVFSKISEEKLISTYRGREEDNHVDERNCCRS